tara:strand:- start:62 stop:376 length:315 start_codon:yes stop_codon:yes gene_type:complete
MAQFDKFLAYKIKHCIEKGIEVDESLLKSLKNEFNVIKTHKAINESKEIEKQIINWRKNRAINSQKAIIGYKDESYFTESEQLIGYVVPTYEELSKEEKKMYNE